MQLETKSLILIPHVPEHLRALLESEELYEQRIGFPPAKGLRGFFVSADVSPEWAARLQTATEVDPWTFGFAVMLKRMCSVIGAASFKGPPDADGVVEIAYGIVPDFQGQGYATEAALALVDYAINSGRVRTVSAHTLPEANASGRVLTKCGFKNVGEVIDPEDGLVWRWEKSV